MFRAEDENEYADVWFLFTVFLTALNSSDYVVQAAEHQNYWICLFCYRNFGLFQ